MRRVHSPAGFLLIDALVALLVVSVVLAGAVAVFATQTRTYKQQDLTTATGAPLRSIPTRAHRGRRGWRAGMQ